MMGKMTQAEAVAVVESAIRSAMVRVGISIRSDNLLMFAAAVADGLALVPAPGEPDSSFMRRKDVAPVMLRHGLVNWPDPKPVPAPPDVVANPGTPVPAIPAGVPKAPPASQPAEKSQTFEAPPHGRFPWWIRARAPGLDCDAVEARAEQAEPITSGRVIELAPFMKYAIASLYDKVVAGRLSDQHRMDDPHDANHPLAGKPPLPIRPMEVEQMLAFAYAACVTIENLHPDE